MKKLNLKQMCKLVDYLSDCYQDYEDDHTLNAVNNTLKILSYNNVFHYDYYNDSFICRGGIEQQDYE